MGAVPVHKGQGAIPSRVPANDDAGRGRQNGPEASTGRTVAVVDLRNDPVAPGDGHPDGEARVFATALRRIEQVVRGEDRVCPFGVARIAVAFGPDADVVSPKRLAERLARAIRLSAVVGSDPAGTFGSPIGLDLPMQTAAEPARIGGADKVPPAATVTVDRATAGFRLRTVVRCASGGFARYGTRRDDVVADSDRGTLLVVSPSRTSGAAPGLSAVATAAMAERLGFDVGVAVLSCDDDLVLEVRGTAVELVVVVVEGEREPAGDGTTWASSMWHVPAQLAANYRAAGIEVLAVGAGGGAGAMANCRAQGATIVLGLDELQQELGGTEEVSPADDGWAGPAAGGRIPRPIEALVQLTASERRVLFYLTTGRSAQDIAGDLVVSVTTVRSHIRSILRKLGVRSQLAAVAIANSQDFGRDRANGDAPEIQRELEAPGVA
jgi:DNA-binding CsgD family transcriptional regulator